MDVICEKCGKPLKKVADLTDSECKDLIYLNNLKQSLDDCIAKLMTVELDSKIKRCIKRLYAKLANEEIARQDYFNKIGAKYKVNAFEIVDGVLYIHEEN